MITYTTEDLQILKQEYLAQFDKNELPEDWFINNYDAKDNDVSHFLKWLKDKEKRVEREYEESISKLVSDGALSVKVKRNRKFF